MAEKRRPQHWLQASVAVGVLIAGLAHPSRVEATALGPEAFLPSGIGYLACRILGFTERECLAIIVDPAGDGITHIALTLKYDPTRWQARPDGAGFLCDFSKDGDCPPAEAQVGTLPIRELLITPGSPLDGSEVSLVVDDVLGLATLDYRLSEPIPGAADRNFFMLPFLPTSPFAGAPVATYFAEPGNYDFSVTSFVCEAIVDGQPATCGSSTPIHGFNVTFVPEPGSLTLYLTGLAGLALLRRAARASRTDPLTARRSN